MANAYRVLGVSQTTSDEEVRRRYLSLVHRFPPEREPAQFRRIQDAYEALRDRRARLRYLTFEPSRGESLEEWIAELRRDAMRPGLDAVREMYRVESSAEGAAPE